jgi:sterol desaturase/sphingolipid hydroxylase (fatty acid hydroxylase superfamily)
VGVLVWLGLRSLSVTVCLLAVLAGYAIWTLTEYLGHRFLFHAGFPGRLGARIHFLVHGVHHIHPKDPLRLVMPPLLSGPIMLTALLAASLLFGLPLGYPTLVGFIFGYVGYDLTHFYVHNATPKGRVAKLLQRNHLLHHYNDPKRGYGVSAPYWDYVFGTQHRLGRPTAHASAAKAPS